MKPRDDRPLVALTMGDVAGIGPEVIARAWGDSPLRALARPFVVGSRAVMERALACVGGGATVQEIKQPEDAEPSPRVIPCLEATELDVADVPHGHVDPRAGRAAYDFLTTAIDLALQSRVDAITTLPLNKEALRAGGIVHPGHTEILAEWCGVSQHAMMLYIGPPVGAGSTGLGVVHVTLHVPLRRVFDLLTEEAIEAKIHLADQALRPLTGGRAPRGSRRAQPACGRGRTLRRRGDPDHRPGRGPGACRGRHVTGPIASDTLFGRALAGEFDAVVAMYHDQGHIALKTIGFDRAVNITLGLPIVRTSVAHGTAYDIAWKGRAETSSLIESVRVAARIVSGRRQLGLPVGAS